MATSTEYDYLKRLNSIAYTQAGADQVPAVEQLGMEVDGGGTVRSAILF